MTPTEAQIKAIAELAGKHAQNCISSGEDRDKCTISVLYNPKNDTDNTITVISKTLFDYDDNNFPIMSTKYNTVKQDGMVVDMELFLTIQEIWQYIANLSKLEMNK